jgi:hypothetical protein
MKKCIALLSILLLAVSWVAAQNTGNGSSGCNTPGGAQSNGNGPQGNSQNQASPYQNWPLPVRIWLDNGAQAAIPPLLIVRVRIAARPWLQQTFGLSMGQIIQKYNNGEITVVYLPTSPPSAVLSFRVSYGGGLIIIEIDDSI